MVPLTAFAQSFPCRASYAAWSAATYNVLSIAIKSSSHTCFARKVNGVSETKRAIEEGSTFGFTLGLVERVNGTLIINVPDLRCNWAR